jgi:hypothetical protein
MNWITILAHQRDQAAERKELFEREATELWESLKMRSKECAASYDRLYPHGTGLLHAQYNETDEPARPFFRCMTRNAANGHYTVEKCRVTLTRSERTIKANYSTDQPELLFTIGTSEKRHTALQHDAKCISLDEACELILRPLLFEDVPSEG